MVGKTLKLDLDPAQLFFECGHALLELVILAPETTTGGIEGFARRITGDFVSGVLPEQDSCHRNHTGKDPTQSLAHCMTPGSNCLEF